MRASVSEIIDQLGKKIEMLKVKVEKLDDEKHQLLKDKLDLVLKVEEQGREIKELKSHCSNLQTASAITNQNTDVADAKEVISSLMQEIDKCIALLNS